MIGTRAHDVGQMQPIELAKQLSSIGAEAVQLVAYKAIEGIVKVPNSINSEIASKIREDFNSNGLKISLLGCYFNVLDDALDNDVKCFQEYLKYAKDFGCSLVGTETGSYDKDWKYHPNNHNKEAYRKVLDVISQLVSIAEEQGVNVGVEGVYNHVIYSPMIMNNLLNDIQSDNIQVIFDPVNYINLDNYKKIDDIIDEAFDRFSDRIAIVHAKDFVINNNKIIQVPLGSGLMNYDKLVNRVKEQEREIDIIIEELEGKDLIKGIEYLKSKVK